MGSGMDAYSEFDDLRRDSEPWRHTTRRTLLREATVQALDGKREARVLDVGCTAELEFDDAALYRVCNLHGSLKRLAFRQMEGGTSLVGAPTEKLGGGSHRLET